MKNRENRSDADIVCGMMNSLAEMGREIRRIGANERYYPDRPQILSFIKRVDMAHFEAQALFELLVRKYNN